MRHRLIRQALMAAVVVIIIGTAADPGLADDSSGAEIGEIRVVGLTRTPEQVVMRQLPFAVGDRWNDAFIPLIVKRLATMEIFDPLGTRVTVEPIGLAVVRVVIRVSEPHVLYNDPIEFFIVHTQELMSDSFYQTLRNPFGIGLNISGGGRWGYNPSISLGASFPLEDGWMLRSSLSWSDARAKFLPQGSETPEYHYSGTTVTCTAAQQLTPEWSYSFGCGYQHAEVSLNQGPYGEQNYLWLNPRLTWSGWATISLSWRYAFDLAAGGSDWWALSGRVRKAWTWGPDILLVSTTAGYLTETGLNNQFVMGGFGSLPLRGHGSGFIGHAFLHGTLEYRKSIPNTPLWLIGFADAGEMWYRVTGGGTDAYDWQLDAGLGLACSTPLGFPVRFDVARGLRHDAGWNWRIYLDFQF